jgi:urease accessory protein
MERDAKKMRANGPLVFAQVKHGVGLSEITSCIIHAYQHAQKIPH